MPYVEPVIMTHFKQRHKTKKTVHTKMHYLVQKGDGKKRRVRQAATWNQA